MKEEALAIVHDVVSPAQKLNLLREYLQAFTMRSLHESEAFLCLSFVGGTALRFLFDLPRFSEDLDFSLENAEGYEPVKWMEKLKRDLSFAGFNSTISWNDRKTVHTGWVRTADLLHEIGLSTMPEQKLSIKIEIDTRPPKGAVDVRAVVNRHMVFAIRHHDLSSLMAGKIHVLATRSYVKGRDWYDLLWYRGRRPPVEPNLILLQNALTQTEGQRIFDVEDWRSYLVHKLHVLDQKSLIADVRAFLERPQEAELLTVENFRAVLQA